MAYQSPAKTKINAMENTEEKPKKDAKWGSYWFVGFLVAAVCLGILIYIGWIDNNTHVDSDGGDNVIQSYATVTPQPKAPGINDWNNPDGSSLRQIIVDHAAGTDTRVLPQ